MVAGGSEAAVKRAAKHGLGIVLQTNHGGLKELYENECRAHGHEPGFVQLPADGAPTAVFVADDVDQAWDELGPYLLHDAVTAASYRHGDEGGGQHFARHDVQRTARGQRPVPRLHHRRGGRLHARRPGPAARAAVRRAATGPGVAVPRAGRRRGRPASKLLKENHG